MTENNDSPRRRREIINNLTIRRDNCYKCIIFQDVDRENTKEELHECVVCYSGLKQGKNMEYILKRYRMKAD